ALGQMDRVSEIVFLSEAADGVQQLGRRRFGERGRGKHADASLLGAMPRGEQVIDAAQTLVAQPGREPGGNTSGEPLRRHWASNILAIVDGLREHAAQAGLR